MLGFPRRSSPIAPPENQIFVRGYTNAVYMEGFIRYQRNARLAAGLGSIGVAIAGTALARPLVRGLEAAGLHNSRRLADGMVTVATVALGFAAGRSFEQAHEFEVSRQAHLDMLTELPQMDREYSAYLVAQNDTGGEH